MIRARPAHSAAIAISISRASTQIEIAPFVFDLSQNCFCIGNWPAMRRDRWQPQAPLGHYIYEK
jgi:hypothetical protein